MSNLNAATYAALFLEIRMQKTILTIKPQSSLPSDAKLEALFDEVLISYLKLAAESDMTLEDLAQCVHDDISSSDSMEPIFDGSLDSFSSLMLERLGLRAPLGKMVLEHLCASLHSGEDIYDLVDALEREVQSCLRNVAVRLKPRREVKAISALARSPSFYHDCIPVKAKRVHVSKERL